jgi:hypothetical protein
MKVVDIADEIYRELGEVTSLSIPAIAFWVRTNIGALNSFINTTYSINTTTLELEQTVTDATGAEVILEIGEEERSILKKMYMVHHYDRQIRSNITTLESVTKVNRNEINRVFYQIKKQEHDELRELINAFKLSKAVPIQIAGNDTVEGRYSLSIDRLGGSLF